MVALPEFEASDRNVRDVMGVSPFAVATGDGKAVIWHRDSGTSNYLTYRSRRGADIALARASAVLDGLEVVTA